MFLWIDLTMRLIWGGLFDSYLILSSITGELLDDQYGL